LPLYRWFDLPSRYWREFEDLPVKEKTRIINGLMPIT
jgi:hypothetical protein